MFEKEVCVEISNCFWNRKQHMISLPYEQGFEERNIPKKGKTIQMKEELLNYCKKGI